MSVRRRNVRERVERERKFCESSRLMDLALARLNSPEGLAAMVRDGQMYRLMQKLQAQGASLD